MPNLTGGTGTWHSLPPTGRRLRWLRRAAAFLFLGLVGEASAHGVWSEAEFSKGNCLSVEINCPSVCVFEKLKCFSGSMRTVIADKIVSYAHYDKKVTPIAGGRLFSLFEARRITVQLKWFMPIIVWEKDLSESEADLRHRFRETAYFLDFSGHISARNWFPLGYSVLIDSIGQPVSTEEWRNFPENVSIDSGSFADVFKRIKDAGVPSRAGAPSLGIVAELFDWPDTERYPWPLISLHRVQLASHYAQLTPKNTSGNDANYYQRASEPSDVTSPTRHHRFVDLMWALFFFAAAALFVFISFKSTEYADDHGFTCCWWVPFLAFIAAAFWCANHALTSLDSRSEDVLVMPVIVAEREFRDIQMQILFADLVESADATAFDQRPEALNRLSVTSPTTYCSFRWSTVAWGYSLPSCL
jgi:hypothetical protein